MKEAQEMWKSMKEDKCMSEQQYCEGLKKISELVGNDQQLFQVQLTIVDKCTPLINVINSK